MKTAVRRSSINTPQTPKTLGVIANAHSPHYGEVVEILSSTATTVTVRPEGRHRFTFAYAEMPKKDVRFL